jgi:cytochrome c-type biogenesis protein CcmH/NrfF
VHLLWIVPVAVLVIGLVPVLAAAGRVAQELHALHIDLQRMNHVRPAVVEIRDDADLLRRRAAALRARR